ncbi:3-methyl-2-oxobutanoate hydroxymethyltransferase [Quadrisphaera sp. DSM 44207]|uniref:3-methyl-2-oxobutanoate hydroxymethyltransferase n=1 Tax=Quadrisphaera sp. DSM 44207 TaxID=1881057 RepID=UPI000888B637|nr:3-methyl-2-oxobutanoate hydroxymethyltransferase [Quadrisphaera sp. DSM 44207]SDQ04138.1 ketopantoate hydroxymethyltransferase [Quadrisphaera sp. DSM 44207]
MSEPAIAPKRVRVHHLRQMKAAGQPIAMLTAYDALTAAIFDEAGIDVLLVGDSMGDNLMGYATTLPVTVEELLPHVRAVADRGGRPLVVADLPFGSYEVSPEQAVTTAVRFLKEGRAHAVKFEGGARVLPQVRAVTGAGIAFMGHLGYTPQSVHSLGGPRVQGRGDAGDRLLADALALQEAGAFAIVLEVVPAPLAQRVSEALEIPTIGIGAGAGCDGQVLVWTDVAGLTPRMPKLAKAYADVRGALLGAAREYAAEVRARAFPAEEHTHPE